MNPEQLFQKLQPLFRQLRVPDMKMNPHGYYSLTLETGEVYLEKTELNTLIMIAFLPMPENPGEEMLLELLQANLTPDQESNITIAADKEENKLVLWGSLKEEDVYLEKLMMMLEKINITLAVISRWFNKLLEEDDNKKGEVEKTKFQSNQTEQFLNQRK